MLKKIATGVLALIISFLPLSGRVMADSLPTNLIANPSMETATSSTAPANWTASSWGTNSTTFSYEPTGHTGTHSVKTTITSYTDGDAKWLFDDVAVTPGTTYSYSNWYKSDIDSEIDVQFTNTDGTVTYDKVVTTSASPSAWTYATGQFVAPATAKTVTLFQVINKVGYVQVDDASLSIYTPTQFDRGIVSLTFDDGLSSQYTNGLPLLDKYADKATFYAISGYIAQPDYMDTAMLQAFQADGQEIGSHTVTHPDLTTLTLAQIDQELSDSKTTIQGLFGTGSALNFASPYGTYNSTVIGEIQKYYRSHRSTDTGYNSKDSFDVYNIKVQNIFDATTPAEVAAWVTKAQTDKTWLVVVYHAVSADPDPTIENYSVTPANLETELAAMKQSGITVETINQAIDEIQPQLTTPTAPTAKPGDINGDGTVDALDLSTLLTNWNKSGATTAQGDINGDGTVDALDLSTLLVNWSK